MSDMELTNNQLKAKLREAFIAGGRYYAKGTINSPMQQEIKKTVKNAKGFDVWFSEFDTNKHTNEANLNIGCVTKQRKMLIAIIEQFNEDTGFPTDNSNIPEFVDAQLKAIYGW